jgi:hypothetical protein
VIDADMDNARRVAFVFGRVANSLGIPAASDAVLLLESAMQEPSAVSSEDYEVIYRMYAGGRDIDAAGGGEAGGV